MTTTSPAAPAWEFAQRARRLDALLVFVFAIGVSLASLPHRSGYPLGDAVEYLKNAGSVENGEGLASGSVRPFFFSALLLPILRVARVFGSSDGREVFAIVTGLMLIFGGLTVVAVYRFVERAAGAAAALAAALFLASNRVFQFWTPNAMTDVPCAMCIAAAAAVAIAPPSRSNALKTGLLLGGALIFKYQALQAVGLFLFCIPFLWRSQERPGVLRGTGYMVGGAAAGIVLQSALDVLAGRPFGVTLGNYMRDNVVYPLGMRATPMLEVIFGKERWRNFFGGFFDVPADFDRYAEVHASTPEALMKQDSWFYLRNLPELLNWFETVFLVVGFLVLVKRRPRAWWFAPVFVVTTAVILSGKGSKDFRLWIPFLPFVFCIVGVGFAAIIQFFFRRLRPLAAPIAFIAIGLNIISILGGMPLQTSLARVAWFRPLLAYDARTPYAARLASGASVEMLKGWRPWQIIPEPRNPADFGGYARAAQWLNEYAPAGSRVSATWFWQFHFHLRPDLFLVTNRYQLDDYERIPEARDGIVTYLQSLDFLVVHLSSILHPPLFEIIDREFETLRTFENPIYDESLDTIFVLRKRAKPGDERAWLRVLEGAEADAVYARTHPDRLLHFVTEPGRSRRAVVDLLQCDFDRSELREGRVSLLLTWRVPQGTVCADHDIRLQLKVTNSRNNVIGNEAYSLGYGRLDPSRWKPGVVIEQRIPIRPARELYDFAWPRGVNDSVSLDAWVQLICLPRAGGPSRVAIHYPIVAAERFSRLSDPVFGRTRIGGIDCPLPRWTGR